MELKSAISNTCLANPRNPDPEIAKPTRPIGEGSVKEEKVLNYCVW